jgi:hypothetical protein
MRIACGQVFTSEFVGGWLGFFTAPEVLLYGLVWENYPNGIWAYRWGDQQFWKSAVGLFDDGSHVEDVSYVRTPPGIFRSLQTLAKTLNPQKRTPMKTLSTLDHVFTREPSEDDGLCRWTGGA